MSKFGDAVIYNGGTGKERQLALVRASHGDTADLVVFTEDGTQFENGVPRRDPSDYAAGGGGGRTWHPHS